jgi:ribonuclease VapC
MIVDSSALVAIVLEEVDGDQHYAAIRNASSSAMAAPTYLETAIVVDARPNPLVSNRLDPLLAQLNVEVAPFTNHTDVRVALAG